MNQPAAILGLDVIASLLAVAWMRWGLWLDLYGFSVYRNRSGRWVPRPATAMAYLKGIAYSGTLLFVALFILMSLFCLYLARRGLADNNDSGHFRANAFYGGNGTLAFKYSVFVLSIGVAPAFYYYLWNLPASDAMRIGAGFAITALTFMVPMLVVSWLTARRTHHPRPTAVRAS